MHKDAQSVVKTSLRRQKPRKDKKDRLGEKSVSAQNNRQKQIIDIDRPHSKADSEAFRRGDKSTLVGRKAVKAPPGTKRNQKWARKKKRKYP
jgi:hypothetical protein